MNTFDFIKEATGGTTIVENNKPWYFGPHHSPRFKVRGTQLVITINDTEFAPAVYDTIRINPGTGLTTFAGNLTQLITLLIPVFPNANTSSGGTGGTVEKQFTDAQVATLLIIIEAYTNP
jgi:hypothetical protein